MKLTNLLVTAFLFPAIASAAETIKYDVAHIKQGGADTVFVVMTPNFFNSDAKLRPNWYKSVQSCVRSNRLAGDVMLVANFNGRFNYYGPNSRATSMQSVNMKWVRDRVNKQMSCTY
jgi:hypothetical protein